MAGRGQQGARRPAMKLAHLRKKMARAKVQANLGRARRSRSDFHPRWNYAPTVAIRVRRSPLFLLVCRRLSERTGDAYTAGVVWRDRAEGHSVRHGAPAQLFELSRMDISSSQSRPARRSWAEPWKIKIVEPITMTTRDAARARARTSRLQHVPAEVARTSTSTCSPTAAPAP